MFNIGKSKYRSNDTIRNFDTYEIITLAEEAISETKKKNYLAAIHLYRKIIADYPDLEIIRNNLGCCFAGIGKLDDAETEFVEALRITKTKRDKGIRVARSYPKEPLRNLIKVYKSITKNLLHSRTLQAYDQSVARLATGENAFQKLIRVIMRDGIVIVLKKIPSYLIPRLNTFFRWQEKVMTLRAEAFDRNNNIDTASALYQKDFGINSESLSHARHYISSDALSFHNALSSLNINFSEYTFIDFGSGKGKALFLASAYAFKKIIGIEFSETLHTISQHNIRQFYKDNIEAYCVDAVEYKIPEESIICYFYDPFDAYIMAKVISNLRQTYTASRRNIVIVYNNTRFYALFDAEKWLERLPSIGPIMIWSSKKDMNA